MNEKNKKISDQELDNFVGGATSNEMNNQSTFNKEFPYSHTCKNVRLRYWLNAYSQKICKYCQYGEKGSSEGMIRCTRRGY